MLNGLVTQNQREHYYEKLFNLPTNREGNWTIPFSSRFENFENSKIFNTGDGRQLVIFHATNMCKIWWNLPVCA